MAKVKKKPRSNWKWDEFHLTCACMNYMDTQYPNIFASHLPSGEHRTPETGAKLKKMGLKKGLPDIQIYAARHGYHGLCIELKRTAGAASKSQKELSKKLLEEGYLYQIVRAIDEFKELVDKYLRD